MSGQWLLRPPGGACRRVVGVSGFWGLAGLLVPVRVFDNGCMLVALEQVTSAAAECAGLHARPLADSDLVGALDAVHAAEASLAAVKAHLVRELDARAIPVGQGATSTAAWLRGHLRLSPYAARSLLALATALDRSAALDTAVGAGAVTAEQAIVIDEALGDLPAEVSQQVRADAEACLIGYASQFEPPVLRRLGARILAQVAPDVAERLEADKLAREAERARAQRALRLTGLGDGRTRITGWLDSEAAAIVNAALDPLCTPTGGDTRSPAQRRADALTDVCALALRSDQLPASGGEAAHVVVTLPYPWLQTQTGAGGFGAGGFGGGGFGGSPSGFGGGDGGGCGGGAGGLGTTVLDTGERLTPEQARRIACDAGIIPVVLDGDGQPLDVGRTKRLVTAALHRALTIRDGGCAFPGCDRPARWCQVHHIRHWADGGDTSLANTTLLCGHHHGAVHHDGWGVRLAADGHPEFIPPAYVDPQRRPRRNHYHHHQQQHRQKAANARVDDDPP